MQAAKGGRERRAKLRGERVEGEQVFNTAKSALLRNFLSEFQILGIFLILAVYYCKKIIHFPGATYAPCNSYGART